MRLAPSLRSTLRIGAIVAGAHFLLFHTVFGLMLLAPRSGITSSVIGIAGLCVLAALIAPAALLPIYGSHGGPAFFFPPGSAIPVAFASVVWAAAVCIIWVVGQRFVRYRPGVRVLRLSRRLALVFALVSITWLFFGPVSGFAGDIMFGILDPARYMDGQYQVRWGWLLISALAWAAGIFGSYRLVFGAPSTRELTPTV
jgi:hypothetical protein